MARAGLFPGASGCERRDFRSTRSQRTQGGWMNTMKAGIRSLLVDEEGATAAEYALLASLIAAVIAVAVAAVGTATDANFQKFLADFRAAMGLG